MHPLSRRFTSWFLRAAPAVLLCCGVRADLSTGLDLCLDGSLGLTGKARDGESLHGLALGHLGWVARERETMGLTEAYLSVLTLHGRGPTGRYLGDFLAASNSEGFASTRLYAWWLEAGGVSWSLRVGALLGDEEFATTDGGAEFMNSGFGWPAFLSANTLNAGPAYSVPALGVRFRHTRGDQGAWQVGVYDGDSYDSADGDPLVNRHGTRFDLGGAQGCLVIAEAAWSFVPGGNKVKVGAWLHTADFSDMRDDAMGQPHALSGAEPRLHGSNHGVYAACEFDLGGRAVGAEDGARLFVRMGWAPADRNTISWAIDAGVSKRGLLPGRPADVGHLGLVHAVFSSRRIEHERLAVPGAAPGNHERVIEAGYTIALGDNWSVKPDLQYIRLAGGGAGRGEALVLLIRSQHTF
jgi:porin